nr:hypothetical protein [Halomonas sp.]
MDAELSNRLMRLLGDVVWRPKGFRPPTLGGKRVDEYELTLRD